MLIEQPKSEAERIQVDHEYAIAIWLQCVASLVARHWRLRGVAGAAEIRPLSNTLCDLYDTAVFYQLQEVQRDVAALSRRPGYALAEIAGPLAEFAVRYRLADEVLHSDRPAPTRQDWWALMELAMEV